MQLGAEVRRLQVEQIRLRDLLTETTDVTSEISRQVVDQGKTLAELVGTVDALAAEETEPTNPPVRWPALTAEEAAREWSNLGQWLAEELVPWYRLTRGQLPDCWALHTRALVELSWLRQCYLHAYLRRSHPTGMAEWHTRWLSAALSNIKEAIPPAMCRPGEHDVHAEQSQENRRQRSGGPPAGRPERLAGGDPPWVASSSQNVAAPPPPPAAAGGSVHHFATELDELAELKHWRENFMTAQKIDLTARRQREQAAKTPADSDGITPDQSTPR